MGLRAGMPMSEIKSRLNDDKFDSNQVQAFLEVLSEENIEHTIESGMYRKEIWSEIARYPATEEDVLHFIQMLVYTIDFKSPHTVNHSVNTTFISLFLAQKFGLNDRMQDMIYIAALLHDIGKVCIPVEILENPGKLSEGDMHIMRQHVSYSEEILDGTFAQDIVEMAVRHHEKLDGTGYPRGLTAGELTIPQRIVAVADICSALLSRRSYKDSYSKERTLLILKEMSEAGLVDEEGVSILTENFDELIQLLVEVNEPVQVMYQNIMEEYTKINKRAILH